MTDTDPDPRRIAEPTVHSAIEFRRDNLFTLRNLAPEFARTFVPPVLDLLVPTPDFMELYVAMLAAKIDGRRLDEASEKVMMPTAGEAQWPFMDRPVYVHFANGPGIFVTPHHDEEVERIDPRLRKFVTDWLSRHKHGWFDFDLDGVLIFPADHNPRGIIDLDPSTAGGLRAVYFGNLYERDGKTWVGRSDEPWLLTTRIKWGEDRPMYGTHTVRSSNPATALPWFTPKWPIFTLIEALRSRMATSSPLASTAPRPVRRAAARAGGEFRILDIAPRHQPSDGERSTTTTSVDWQRRWIVRGHWRSQPCGPGLKSRRPVWVTPHVKGPDDKPLDVRPTVFKVDQ